jgi:hypothetical protein
MFFRSSAAWQWNDKNDDELTLTSHSVHQFSINKTSVALFDSIDGLLALLASEAEYI